MSRFADTESFTNILLHCVQITAIFVGAAWAYFKFFRGRTFWLRGDLTVKGELRFYDDEPCLMVTVIFHNAGLSSIPLPDDLAQLYVDWLPSSVWSPGTAAWASTSAPPDTPAPLMGNTLYRDSVVKNFAAPVAGIFKNHKRIEPGETLTDSLLYIPEIDEKAEFPMAFQIRAAIVGDRRLRAVDNDRRHKRGVLVHRTTHFILWTANAIVPTEALRPVRADDSRTGD